VSDARLLITADDYGYSPRYDEGILRAARAHAIDAAGAMVLRDPAPGPLLETGIEIGLHVESGDEKTGEEAARALEAQLRRFEELFGRRPDYIDGHHHSHAEPPLRAPVIQLAAERGVRVRSVDAEHREELRRAGIASPDRLIGRFDPAGPLVPLEIAAVEGGGAPPAGVTEWMVHPGLADPSSGSSYDAAREDDLAELLRLTRDEVLCGWRGVGL
jgi:chitin disaccharide deacetylase